MCGAGPECKGESKLLNYNFCPARYDKMIKYGGDICNRQISALVPSVEMGSLESKEFPTNGTNFFLFEGRQGNCDIVSTAESSVGNWPEFQSGLSVL